MSTATPEQLRQLAEQAQNFAPEAALRPRRPSQFLSLAPSTSDSFPRKPSNAEPLTTEALASISAAPNKQRRASSLSSDASKNQFRFLKLGPVHWGEHIDEDNKGDFHEVAVEE